MISQDLGSILSHFPTDEPESSVNDSYSDDFIELSSLGYLSEEVDWCGHKFVLRTLKVGEEIVAGKIIREDEQSVAGFKATHAVVLAAALVSVNGQHFLPALTDDLEATIRLRYKYICEHWFWPTVEFLAVAHNKLVQRQIDVITELQKKLSGGLTDSSGLSANSTDKESSPDQT